MGTVADAEPLDSLSTSINVNFDDEENNSGARFLMQASSLRIFVKAIVSLSKLGDVLYLQPTKEGLFVKALNKCRTASGVYFFSIDFFSETNTQHIDPEKTCTCRIFMKSALSVFKGAHFSERNFLSCDLRIDPEADSMKVDMQLVHDVRRVYDLHVMERSRMHRAVQDKTKLKNCVVLPAETILNRINQMRNDADELILHATKNQFILKNFSVRDKDLQKRVKSETKIEREKFSRYSIKRDTEIAFSIKEFKALIQFASQHSASISIYFDFPASPLVAAIECDVNYTAEFSLATVETDDVSFLTQDVQADVLANEVTGSTTEHNTNGNSGDRSVVAPRAQIGGNDGYDSFDDEPEPTLRPTNNGETSHTADEEREFPRQNYGQTQPSRQNDPTPLGSQSQPWTNDPPPGQFDQFDEDDAYVLRDISKRQEDVQEKVTKETEEEPMDDLPATPPPITEEDRNGDRDEDEDMLPESPPPTFNNRDNKFRKFFMLNVNSTQHASQVLSQDDTIVFASESMIKK